MYFDGNFPSKYIDFVLVSCIAVMCEYRNRKKPKLSTCDRKPNWIEPKLKNRNRRSPICYWNCFIYCLFVVGQMYMLSCDGHIDTSDVSVALYPPGMNIGYISHMVYA